MDIRTARWHPSRLNHHFITNYLAKAKDKYKSPTPLTMCTAFFLEELIRSERTLETTIMTNDKKFDRHQIFVMPFKSNTLETTRSEISYEEDEEEEEESNKWSLYLVVRGEMMVSRFPPEQGDGNLVIISLGEGNAECENAILQLLYQTAKYPLPKDCMAYAFRVENPDEIHERHLSPSHTRYLDSIESKEKKARWREIWKTIGVVEALLNEPAKTITEILRSDGRIARLETPRV
ncbi:hypothetical protein H072_7892 [Dactylellina haptotyla CBS 200.50]|uniref:Uncharacterized protein n=1 Tax=Dactylellina haptotyla (strain CBS 200.50) TaxID=1284197 RepID=S8BT51_DACHA|nr:hypothetical protein H072_7892 [Dactylellina haptotyla CBS 200.50]